MVYGSTWPGTGVTLPSVSDTPRADEGEDGGVISTRSSVTVALPLLRTFRVWVPAPRPASV
jgi:hypothetical protein